MADEAAPVSYYRQVRPVLQRNCSGCHQPAKAGGKLLLTGFDELLKGGENGAGFVAGDPESSLLFQYIVGDKPQMPLNADPLPKAQVELIRRWIQQGAKDDTPAGVRDLVSAANPPVYPAPPVITALAYSPDSQWLAVNGSHEVLLWKADGSALADRLIGRAPRVLNVAFSPDGQRLAAVGGAPSLFGEVQLWDVASRKLTQSFTFSFDTLAGVAFSGDSKLLSFGGFDNKLRAIQVADGKQILTMDTHSDAVLATTFSLKNDHLISVSRDMSMKLTEVQTGQFVDNITSITPGALKGGLATVARHPLDEQVLIGGADGEPKLYKIFRTQARQIGDDFNRLKNYEKLPGRIFSLQFNADGSQFVVGASNATSGVARIYNTERDKPNEQGKPLHELAGITSAVYAVAFRPDGQQVAVGGFDGHVRLYDVASGKLVKEFFPINVTPAVANSK